jgi:hypothetical protein
MPDIADFGRQFDRFARHGEGYSEADQHYESIWILCLASDSVPPLDQVHYDPAVDLNGGAEAAEHPYLGG